MVHDNGDQLQTAISACENGLPLVTAPPKIVYACDVRNSFSDLEEDDDDEDFNSQEHVNKADGEDNI
eukprot:5725800-Karenia_brevis.AAC.1